MQSILVSSGAFMGCQPAFPPVDEFDEGQPQVATQVAQLYYVHASLPAFEVGDEGLPPAEESRQVLLPQALLQAGLAQHGA